AWAYVDVVGAGEVGAVGGAQEAETVLQNLENAFAEDVLAVLLVRLEDREDDVLLARPGEVLEPHGIAELDEIGRRPRLELGEIHRVLRQLELSSGNHVDLLIVWEVFPHRLAATRRPLAAVAVPGLPLVVLDPGAC